MKTIGIGSIVKHAGITDRSIPAFKNMRGTVIELGDGCCLVSWDCGLFGQDRDVNFRKLDTVELAED
jgi:hypothetical protein